jgi:hypothetical protein
LNSILATRLRPSFADDHAYESQGRFDLRPMKAAGGRWLSSDHARQDKKEAERRQTCIPTSARKRRAARAEAQRARLSAFHRGTCCSEPTPQLSSRRASWDVEVS